MGKHAAHREYRCANASPPSPGPARFQIRRFRTGNPAPFIQPARTIENRVVESFSSPARGLPLNEDRTSSSSPPCGFSLPRCAEVDQGSARKPRGETPTTERTCGVSAFLAFRPAPRASAGAHTSRHLRLAQVIPAPADRRFAPGPPRLQRSQPLRHIHRLAHKQPASAETTGPPPTCRPQGPDSKRLNLANG